MNIKTIQATVASYFDISLEEMLSRDRHDRISFPRHVAMHLAFEVGHKTTTVGKAFGRCRSDVSHATRSLKNRMDTNPAVLKTVEGLRASVNNSYQV